MFKNYDLATVHKFENFGETDPCFVSSFGFVSDSFDPLRKAIPR